MRAGLTSIFRSDLLHGALENVSWLMGERIFRLVVNLAVGAYIARYLGPAGFGSLSYASSFVGLFTAFILLGLPRILVRDLVRTPARSGELLGSTFALMVLGGLAALAVLAALVPMLDITSTERWMIIAIGAGLIFQSSNVIELYFQSVVQSRYAVKAQLAQLLFSSVLKLGLIHYQADLVWFAVATAFDSVVLAVTLMIAFRLRGNSPPWKFELTTATELMKEAWPLIFSTIAITVYMKIDQVMLRAMLGSDAVGQYSAAVRISEAWYFIPVVITSSVFPAIIKARENNPAAYERKIQSLLNLMVGLAVLIAIPVTLFSEQIVSIVFGPDYHEAVAILVIHIWAAIFVFLNNALQQWYIAEGLARMAAVRTGTGLIVNILLNYLLIPRYGPVGAAWATLVSRMMVSFVLNFLFTRTRPMFWMVMRSFTLGLPLVRHD